MAVESSTKSTILNIFDCFNCQMRRPNFIIVYAQNRKKFGVVASVDVIGEFGLPSRAKSMSWIITGRSSSWNNQMSRSDIYYSIVNRLTEA